MGAAAAMQAFKMFSGGGGGGGGSGDMKTKLLSMAMAQASQLFDAQGGGAGGSKQEAVTSAAQNVMKMLMQVRSLVCRVGQVKMLILHGS